MLIHLATVGDGPGPQAARRAFRQLADLDELGEHRIEDDPERADALLVVDLQQHPADPFLRALRSDKLVRTYPSKVYVYDERDRPFFTFPGIYVAATPRDARHRPIVGGPYPNLPNAPCASDRPPDLLFSFQGGRTHAVRDAVLSLKHPRAVIEDTSALSFFDWTGQSSDAELQAGRARYADVVPRSKFVLCPRGHGTSSFRLYETLAAGRVPVVISDDWLPPPRVDWHACAVRVAERDARSLPEILEQLEDRWQQMADAGRAATGDHLASSRLWHHYATSIAQLRHAARLSGPWWAQAPVVRIWARRALQAARPQAPQG